jgi:hypothetical protein
MALGQVDSMTDDKTISRIVSERGQAEQEEGFHPNDPMEGAWFWVRHSEVSADVERDDEDEDEEMEEETGDIDDEDVDDDDDDDEEEAVPEEEEKPKTEEEKIAEFRKDKPHAIVRQGMGELGCVTHIGSNYAEVQFPGTRDGYRTLRVHFDNWHKLCTHEPNADAIIHLEVATRQQNVKLLMGKVQQLTAGLSITPSGNLTAGDGEANALVRHSGGNQDVKSYKKALIKAKTDTLPDLFKKVEQEHAIAAVWMGAPLLPLQVKAGQLKPLIDAIEGRIFNVELYAGLVEEVEKVKDGETAPVAEKIRLFQRRCYMDEECLARYEAGGMEFKHIREFDKWLVRPDNLERLLPFQRCIVAFRVRRDEKDRRGEMISGYVQMKLEEADKLTFLYIRNGEQVHRLTTEIDFHEKLFPDIDRATLLHSGQLYAKHGSYDSDRERHVHKVISEGELLQLKRNYKAESKRLARARKEYMKLKEEFDRQVVEAKAKGLSRGDTGYPKEPAHVDSWNRLENGANYFPYSKKSVRYDDVTKDLREDIEEHNRIVYVLQGLLDRSPVLHPHPPWQLWTPEGFESALTLVYDQDRALTTGDKPDFEAYRARLNASLKTGSVTVGQDDFWAQEEAEKENERLSRRSDRYRYSSFREYTHFRPSGNPGPGVVAKVTRMTKDGCSFSWEKARERIKKRRWRSDPLPDESPVKCTLTVPKDKLLNIDAYKPGDFKQFFDDPRTRAEYLKWAPYLLEAEEYHAGKREPGAAKDVDDCWVED